MPQCVFKSCRNNSRKSNSTAGVSYFRFPSNPFTCAEWISIVARERRDDFYKPATNSVICSDHFDELDISGNTNRRRLVKTAVPKLQIQPPSEDSQLAAQNTKLSVSDIEVHIQPPSEDSQLAAQNTKLSVSDIEVHPSSSCSGFDITPKRNHNQDQTQHESVMSSPIASVSDLISRCETPRKRFLNKQLLTARKIIDNKSKKIQTLQKVNKRLVKKIRLLKNIICNNLQ